MAVMGRVHGAAAVCTFAAAMLAWESCVAQDHPETSWIVHLGGLTQHFENDANHDDLNYGLGLEYARSQQLGFVVGNYRNSDYAWSKYAFLRYEPLAYGALHAGALAGIVTGYTRHRGAVIPGAIPALSADLGALNLTLIVIPKVAGVDACVSLLLGLAL
jgi:hypothetical protein